MGIGDEFKEGLTNVQNLIGENPFASVGTAAVVGAGVGAGVTGLVMSASKKRKKKTKKSKKKSSKSKKKSRKLKFGSPAWRKKYMRKKRKGRRTPRTAGKGKDRSSKRIRYTKRGQPYIIMRNGRARFIKRSSARSSHKLKGGRY